MDHKKDVDAAERAYRRALELNPDHTTALGNLANLVADRGDRDLAAKLYRKALRTPGPGHENAAWNYAKFLLAQSNDRATAIQVLENGIANNPESARLLLLYAEVLLLERRVAETLQALNRAREKGAEEARIETCYACALHLSAASVGECIAAYRAAIALSPQNGTLRLNLAQLLFVKGENQKANVLLREALKLGIDSSVQLEAQLYFLCHTEADPSDVAKATKELLKEGARLQWDVRPNIAFVRCRDPHRAALAELFLEVMEGRKDPGKLDLAVSLVAEKDVGS